MGIEVSNLIHVTPSLGEKNGERHKHKSLQGSKNRDASQTADCPIHVALFPCESSHFETMCSLEFQMAKLRNQTIRQKVLVSTMIILGTSGRECVTASFLMKVEEKPRTDMSQMATEMGFSGFCGSFPHLQMWL